MPLILGIDPGLSGALVILDTYDVTLTVLDMPTVELVKGGKKRRELQAALLVAMLQAHEIDEAAVERVGTRPGESPVAAFSFGRGCGVIEGALAALHIPTTFYQPREWQKAMGMAAGGGKDAARNRAMQLYPSFSSSFARVKDDGRADAALIASAHAILRVR